MQQLRADAGTGAVIGAVAGGIIGHQSRETAAGVVVGAVAGGLVGAALDRDGGHESTVVTYHGGGPRGGYDDPRWSPRPVRYGYPERRVVYVPAPRPRPVVVVVQSPAPCPEPVVVVHPTPAPTCLEDDFGYTSAAYLALMKPAEIGLLRQRAYGTPHTDLAVYLTDQEKGNLRARAARQVVIGE